jgi:hypothetical protein
MNRQCLDCQTAIIGRADKKFCDDQCRSHYNNRIKSEDDSLLKKINQILSKNRKILKAENPNGKVKTKKELLLKQGFDFNYHTHHYSTSTGNTYIFCYEYGYLLLDHDELLLVKKE